MRKLSIFMLVLLFTPSFSVFAEPKRNSELLASSCAACHGTNGASVAGTPSLAGLDKLYFIKQMQQFASGERSSTVMKQHASGYNSTEIQLLADFFSSQSRQNISNTNK